MKNPGSIFRATQDSNGKITIERTRPLRGRNNTFVFSNSEEMKSVLRQGYDKAEIEHLLQELAGVGFTQFTVPPSVNTESTPKAGRKRTG